MVKQSDINMDNITQAMKSLKEMAEYDIDKNKLLVLGHKRIHEPSISNSEKILDIKNNINKYILEKE